jgi:hypothetical protein
MEGLVWMEGGMGRTYIETSFECSVGGGEEGLFETFDVF